MSLRAVSIRSLCLSALFLLPSLGAESGSSAAIEQVVDLTRGAPAEVAADALIRIAGLDQVALTRQRRIELLDQAFQMASASPTPYKRRAALTHTQGPSGFLTRVYAQDLDALSLRLRAVEGLLALDPQRARERFEEIPPLDLPHLTCDDYLAYDVSRFYEVLGQVAAQSFTLQETKKEEPARFLARYLGTINHPAQVTPAARLLADRLPVSDSAFQTLVTGFAGTLSRMAGDDRSFADAAHQAGASIVALADLSERRALSPLVILGAYRTFLVSHLTAARCEDLETTPSSDPATFFNDHLRTPAIPPIGESESTASKREGKAKGIAWCENPECRAIRDEYRTVVFKDNGEAFQEPERDKLEWQARVRDFLSAMASWNQSSGASDLEHFREKVGFYSELVAIVPRSDTREYVVRSMLAFLMNSRVGGEDRLEWYLPVIQLAGRIALDPLGLGRAADDLRRANDPVIALELALELVAPHPVNEFMLLL